MILYIYPGLIWLAVLLSIPAFFVVDAQNKKYHRLIFAIILMVAVLETYGAYSILNSQNSSLFHNLLFVHAETLLILYFFYLNFSLKKVRQSIIISVLLLMMWALINSFFFQPITSIFQTYSFLPSAFLLIICCIYFFYSLIKEEKYQNVNIVSVPTFWIVTAIMFFYACSLMFFAAIPLVNPQNYALVYKVYYLIRALSILMYLTMGLAFYVPLVFKSQKIPS